MFECHTAVRNLYKVNKLNAHCKWSKVPVARKPINLGNQQCLRLQICGVGGLRGLMTFDLAQHARHTARCRISLLSCFFVGDVHFHFVHCNIANLYLKFVNV